MKSCLWVWQGYDTHELTAQGGVSKHSVTGPCTPEGANSPGLLGERKPLSICVATGELLMSQWTA